MAPSRNYPDGLKVAVVTVAVIFSLALVTPKSVHGLPFSSNRESLNQRNMMLGSTPPACVNKCFSCRPCMPALVVPSHQQKDFTFKASSHEDDDHYYLLSWKCKCGDKLFHP